MLELLRQRRWLGFTIFAVVVLVVFLLLARWQWHRYEVRLAENAQLDAALSAPAVDVAEVLAPTPAGGDLRPFDPALTWRMVTATGTFDQSREVAVRRRPLDGRNGFWIVTPLVTDSGVVLVNRGWAPAGGDATETPRVPLAPTGTVRVTGRLRAPEPTTTTDAPPPGQAWAADPQVLLASDVPRFDAYVELRTATVDASEDLVTLTEDPGHRGWNNLAYSVQWVLFAIVGALGWWRLLRQEQTLQQRAGVASDAEQMRDVGSDADVRAAEPAEPEQ